MRAGPVARLQRKTSEICYNNAYDSCDEEEEDEDMSYRN
jgi:hypothetical protein